MLKRLYIQLASLLALHSSWGPELKWLCNPVLSCHSCSLAWFACPIGVLIHYSGYHLFPFLALGTVLLVGVLVGRLLCGWVCPFGFLQDVMYKIRTPKFKLPRVAGGGKYIVLLLLVFLFPFFWGEQTWASFCRFCPASALQVTIPNLISGASAFTAGLALKLGVLATVLLLAIFFSRFFCRVLCPIGALLAPLNYLSFWVVKPAPAACVSCEQCDSACPTDVHPSVRLGKGKPVNRTLDCIVCHDCQKSCVGFRR